MHHPHLSHSGTWLGRIDRVFHFWRRLISFTPANSIWYSSFMLLWLLVVVGSVGCLCWSSLVSLFFFSLLIHIRDSRLHCLLENFQLYSISSCDVEGLLNIDLGPLWLGYLWRNLLNKKKKMIPTNLHLNKAMYITRN